MKIKTNIYQRKSQIRDQKVKHFLIFEGEKTELIYFEQVMKQNKYLNSKILFYLRENEKKSWSHPKKILRMIEDAIINQEDCMFTYDTIIDDIVNYTQDNITTVQRDILCKAFKKCLIDNNVDINTKVTMNKLKNILKMYSNKINKFSITTNEFDFSYLIQVIEEDSLFEKDLDKIHLIVDRDKESFTTEQYKYVLDKCNDLGINFYVTNPCFEFWLLLHHDDCLSIDKLLLLNNKKVNDVTYTYKLLKTFDKSFKKTKFNSVEYMKKIDKAIENSKNFETDINKLINDVGTNLCYLFDHFIKIDNKS